MQFEDISDSEPGCSSMEEENVLVDSMPEDDPNGNVNVQMGAAVPRWGPQHAGARELAGMYSREKRLQERFSIGASSTLFTFVIFRLISTWSSDNWKSVPIAAFLGILTADFASGLVHWGADTFGSAETFIGRNFIRPFREHHVDPTAITRHDFIECNGDNFLLCIPNLAHILYQHFTYTREEIHEWAFIHWYLLLLGVYVAMTNQVC
ncbi:unnamed protein product, partial [Mesorhabditis belari]|uniref:Lipid desaturase domain-containing protein n=1 Tax=Mesorhabditis belari TaxID=2138241 RepID=A0AAF3F3W5_9BILA